MKLKLTNANFPTTADGRTYHVDVKSGEVANRIVTVGDPNRARALAKWLDKDYRVFQHESHRGFLTITGRYNDVPLSIVAIGMGISMMDFFVREVRAVVNGPLAIIRLGSCGSIGSPPVGSMIVPHGAFAVSRNYDYFSDDADNEMKPYNISKIVDADPEMCELLKSELSKSLSPSDIFAGLNATCDSFYSSQGRRDENFNDANEDLIRDIATAHPSVETLEMETFMLYHLAKVGTSAPLKNPQSENTSSIRTAASMMVFADRKNNEFIAPDRVTFLEEVAGKAVLEALSNVKLEHVHDAAKSVWEHRIV